jgi:hypothetical protein
MSGPAMTRGMLIGCHLAHLGTLVSMTELITICSAWTSLGQVDKQVTNRKDVGGMTGRRRDLCSTSLHSAHARSNGLDSEDPNGGTICQTCQRVEDSP